MVDRSCIAEIIDMARHAFGAESPVQTYRSAFMTCLAFEPRVRANKRKPVFMLPGISHCFTPAANAMALFAIASDLSAMNVCVAIGTLRSGVCENHLDMTLSAIQARVHPLQGKPRAPVIKIGERTDRSPACRGVAAGTW